PEATENNENPAGNQKAIIAPRVVPGPTPSPPPPPPPGRPGPGSLFSPPPPLAKFLQAPLAGLGNFDDSFSDLYARRLSHAAAAIRHVHGTNDGDAAFAVRPTLRSAECLTESSAAPPADDPSRRPRPGKATVNGITATTSAPKPKRSNLHRSFRA